MKPTEPSGVRVGEPGKGSVTVEPLGQGNTKSNLSTNSNPLPDRVNVAEGESEITIIGEQNISKTNSVIQDSPTASWYKQINKGTPSPFSRPPMPPPVLKRKNSSPQKNKKNEKIPKARESEEDYPLKTVHDNSVIIPREVIFTKHAQISAFDEGNKTSHWGQKFHSNSDLPAKNIFPVPSPAPPSVFLQLGEINMSSKSNAAPDLITALKSMPNALKNSKSISASPLIAEERDPEHDVFRLQNCSIDFNDVLQATQIQFAVSKIILQDVTFENVQQAGKRRVFLPTLKSFQFTQSIDTSAKLPDKNFMGGLTTKEFLFFEVDKLVPWNFSSLWSLGVQIDLNVKGLRLMELNPCDKKLTLAYPVEEEVDLILESLYKQQDLKCLGLSACHVKSSFDLPTMNLEHLILQGVTFQDGKAMLYINKCHRLKTLSMFEVNGIKVNLGTDLKVQRFTLERLALAKAEIGGWNDDVPLVPFPRLEELYLDVCTWGLYFQRGLPHFFPYLKRIAIRFTSTCVPSATFLQGVLGIQSMERIAVFQYSDGSITGETSTSTNVTDVIRKSYMTEFLSATGLPLSVVEKIISASCRLGGNIVPDFVIEKDVANKSWNVVETNLLAELEEIHFQYSMLNEFFANSAVSKLIQ